MKNVRSKANDVECEDFEGQTTDFTFCGVSIGCKKLLCRKKVQGERNLYHVLIGPNSNQRTILMHK